MQQDNARAVYRDEVAKYTDRKLATAIEFMTTWQREGAPESVTRFLDILQAEAAMRRAEDAALVEPEVWS
jgi:3-methyladenine DNA glycosylase AlkC